MARAIETEKAALSATAKQGRLRSPLLEKRARPARPGATKFDVAATVIRVPRAILQELDELAKAEGITRNRLVLAALDELLTARGRPTAADLAPWLPDYLDRRGQPDRE